MTSLRLDLIWQMEGAVPLPAGQSGADAFQRLDPLFDQPGTRHDRSGDSLAFHKKGAASQDPMAAFDAGTLELAEGAAGPELRYRLRSRFLLFCCILPLFFIGMGQLTLLLAKPPADAAKKEAANGKEGEKGEKKDAVKPLHPIDVFLGAPAPDKNKKNEAKERRKPSATTAYVFAGIFAFLYLFGRFNEERMFCALLARQLAG